nr:arsenical pump-driving ATPase [Mesosutterella multiformis]
MKFLENAPHTLFFTGKGGVGKTSVAAAAAVALAGLGKRVLLVSTDPASNVSEVFDQPIGNQVTAIQSVPGLSAIEIDPQAAAAAYREKLIQPIQGLLPEETVASITEQLSGACTTEIAAFDEFTGLLTDPGVTSQYDHILFDTAPTGHTIRLLELPGAWSQYLDANPNGTSCLGPVSGLDKQRSQYAAAVRSLSDPAETQLVLVARAHRASIREAARTSDELAGIKNQYLVLNGVMPATESASGALAQSICLRERKAITEIPEPLKSLPRDTLSLKPRNMVGVDALRTLFIKETGTKPEATAFMPPEPKPLSDLIDELSGTDHGLIMLMGKGGVGKTTMAAAIAARLAKLGFDVHLSTSDPAAHVDAALAGSVPGLTVSRIDPEKETENYRALVLKTQGAGLDEAGKKLLEEDLRSPCTEEIAVFQAFSRVIREADKRFVVMDTAPTGHTLLLLDAAGAYHREVVRKMGETGSGTTPLTLLQNPDMTRVIIVTLPETTPVLEAKGLEADLRRAGIAPWGYIVNDSLAAADPESPLLRERATSELPLIRKIESESPRTAIVPLQAEEPVGVEKLLSLTI